MIAQPANTSIIEIARRSLLLEAENRFRNLDEIAQELGVERTKLIRARKLLKLPEIVLNCLEAKGGVPIAAGLRLLAAVKRSNRAQKKAEDMCADPSCLGHNPINAILDAVDVFPDEALELPLFGGQSKRRQIGTVQGINQEDGVLVIRLRRTAPKSIRSAVRDAVLVHATTTRPKD